MAVCSTAYREVSEAAGGDDPGKGSNNDRAHRGDDHVRACAHSHPASQRGILDMLHAELPVRVNWMGEHVGGMLAQS